MTDEHMAARLRAAGEQWRASNDIAAGVDVAATVAASETEVVAPAPRRQRHWGLFASAAVVAAALVVGGALVLPGGDHPTGNPEQNQAGLVGRVWELVGYEDANPPSPSPPGPPPHLQLRESSNATFYIGPDGQLVADDSCAVTGGRAEVAEQTITVKDLVQRGYGCIDAAGETVFESVALKALGDGATYAIDGDKMTIASAETTMHFVAAPANIPAPTLDVPTFVGAHWKLVRAVDANGNEVPITGDIPFFVADDRKLTASDGCNTLTGTVTGFYRVRFENVGGTEIGCDIQQTIRPILNGAADESVRGATMTLRKAGAGELTYQWVPEDTAATDPAALDGRTWRISSVGGDPAVSDAQLTINGTTYTANDGCQDFTGHVSVEPGSIAFTGVPPGNPPCGGAGGGQASTIDSFLSSPPTLWSIRDGQLVISGGDSQAFSLVFVDASGAPPTVTNPGAELIGRDWYLVQVAQDSGGTASGHSVTGRLLLRIGGNGGVLLSERCAQGDGTVTFTDSTADFSGIDLTDHSCPYAPVNTDLSEPDTAIVLEVLTGRTTWSLHGDQLSFSRNGSTLTFGPDAPVAAPPYGRKWMLDSREEGNSGMSYDWVSADVAPYLVFDSQGSFTGRDGCVQLSGTVDVQDKTLSFTDVHRDSSGCADKPVTYLNDILTTDLTWSVERGRLDLTVGDLTLGFLHL